MILEVVRYDEEVVRDDGDTGLEIGRSRQRTCAQHGTLCLGASFMICPWPSTARHLIEELPVFQ